MELVQAHYVGSILMFQAVFCKQAEIRLY